MAEAQRAIPAALQGDDFVSKRGAAARRADEERARVLEALNGEAAGLGFAVQVSQAGISIITLLLVAARAVNILH